MMTTIISVLAMAMCVWAVASRKRLLAPAAQPTVQLTDAALEKKRFWQFMALVVLSRVLMWAFVLVLQKATGRTVGLAYFSQTGDAGYGDIPHFLHLAKEGYTHANMADFPNNIAGEYEKLIVFFPMLPLCIRMVSYLVGGNMMLAGVLVGNVSTIVGCGYMYKLLRMDYSRRMAAESVLLMLLYPVAIFFIMPYTEGPLLMFGLMSIYYARKKKFWLAGILGFFSSLTRIQGMLVLAPVLYEWLMQTFRHKRRPRWADALQLLIPAGFGVYLLLNWIYCKNADGTGDFFAFVKFQYSAPWFQSFALFPVNLVQHLDMSLRHPGLSAYLYLPQFLMFFVTLALVFVGIKKRVNTGYLLHTVAHLLVCYEAGWLISGTRYMMAASFLFPILALVMQKTAWRTALYILHAMLFILFSYMYVMHYAIM